MFPSPLPYHPNPGEVLRCDYSNLVPPEMDKIRFVIVVSPRLRTRQGLCTVVPISTTAPHEPQPFHVKLDNDPYPKGGGQPVWVKCDMVMAVSHARLSAYWDGHHPQTRKRNYVTLRVSKDELHRVRIGILQALSMGHLKDAL
jgi:mRNA interferase MazF